LANVVFWLQKHCWQSWWPGFAVEGLLAWQVLKTLPRSEQIKLIAYAIGKATKMSIIPNILGWLVLHKTYIICVGAILTALGAYLSGNLTLEQFIAALFAATAGMTVRRAITTEVRKISNNRDSSNATTDR
jgi:predicted type IV restriction endonuclease